MKIIDLLNKIANGEEVPKKIKVTGTIYEYDEEFKFYFTATKNGRVALGGKRDDINLIFHYNYEPIIIEEEKKIEKIHYSVEADIYETCLVKENRGVVATLSIHDPRPMIYLFKEKINELIDEINKLKEK